MAQPGPRWGRGYNYAGNSPINLVDLLGLEPIHLNDPITAAQQLAKLDFPGTDAASFAKRKCAQNLLQHALGGLLLSQYGADPTIVAGAGIGFEVLQNIGDNANFAFSAVNYGANPNPTTKGQFGTATGNLRESLSADSLVDILQTALGGQVGLLGRFSLEHAVDLLRAEARAVCNATCKKK